MTAATCDRQILCDTVLGATLHLEFMLSYSFCTCAPCMQFFSVLSSEAV